VHCNVVLHPAEELDYEAQVPDYITSGPHHDSLLDGLQQRRLRLLAWAAAAAAAAGVKASMILLLLQRPTRSTGVL
jgi:hypothetical protein